MTTPWILWSKGELLGKASNVEPVLASWYAKTHPSQLRLKSYLQRLMAEIQPLPQEAKDLYLHLDVDVKNTTHLLFHYDLENYLTPLFGRQWFDLYRFVFVSATKRVGGGSHLSLGIAKPTNDPTQTFEYNHFAYLAQGSVDKKGWKQQIHSALLAADFPEIPPGPVKTILAWRCSPKRNWVLLWKPTGDVLGPILGYANPANPFSPNDDRITYLESHLTKDPSMGFSVDIGFWWKGLYERDNDAIGGLSQTNKSEAEEIAVHEGRKPTRSVIRHAKKPLE